MSQPPAPPGPPAFVGRPPATPPPVLRSAGSTRGLRGAPTSPEAAILENADGPDWKQQWMKEAMIEAFVQVLRETMPSKAEWADAIRLGTKEAILEADD